MDQGVGRSPMLGTGRNPLLDFAEGDNQMDLKFPLKGKHVGSSSSEQPADTSRDLNNVRPYFDGKACGGQRPGLDKWGAGTQVGAAEQPIVCLLSVTVAS